MWNFHARLQLPFLSDNTRFHLSMQKSRTIYFFRELSYVFKRLLFFVFIFSREKVDRSLDTDTPFFRKRMRHVCMRRVPLGGKSNGGGVFATQNMFHTARTVAIYSALQKMEKKPHYSCHIILYLHLMEHYQYTYYRGRKYKN